MSMFDQPLGHDESLFEKPGVLDITYLPRLLPYRGDKQTYLAECIKRIKTGGANVLVHGKSGVGKTASVRYVLRQLKKDRQDVFSFYINCWKHDTFYKIIKKMARELNLPIDDRSTETLFEMVVSEVGNYDGVVLAFDEIDQAQDKSFLYQFEEELKYKTIFLISTGKEWYSQEDNRVRSRLSPELVEFEPYNRDETEGILRERMKNAFVSDVWEEKAFQKVVGKTYQKQDIRVGLSLLKKSGQFAENDASRKIIEDYVEQAIESEFSSEEKVDNQSENDSKNLSDFSQS